MFASLKAWLALGAVALWIASVIAASAWYGQVRETAVRADYLNRDNADLTVANARIRTLEEAARAAEHSQSQALAKIGADHEQELADAEDRRLHDVAAARAGGIRLRDRTAVPSCPGVVSSAPAPASGRDAPAGCELSRATTEFLVGLADDADINTRQLASCQAVVRTYLNPTKGASP